MLDKTQLPPPAQALTQQVGGVVGQPGLGDGVDLDRAQARRLCSGRTGQHVGQAVPAGQGSLMLRVFLATSVTRAFSRETFQLEYNKVEIIPMTAMTIVNSSKVKPDLRNEALFMR